MTWEVWRENFCGVSAGSRTVWREMPLEGVKRLDSTLPGLGRISKMRTFLPNKGRCSQAPARDCPMYIGGKLG